MDSLVSRARAVAEDRLVDLPRRLEHVRGVAGMATRVGEALGLGDGEELVAAAWVHDVGYAPSLRATGFHPLDGARFLAGEGFPPSVVSLVAYHTGAAFEAAERGLAEELAEFEEPDTGALDLLTYADMRTGPDGVEVSAPVRLAEILRRYEMADPVHRAVTRSGPELLAAVARVDDRLAAAGASS